MKISPSEVTDVILRWLTARAQAQGCRSATRLIAQYAELGCRPSGGGSAPLRLVGLVAAERPLQRLTLRERRILVEKYWYGAAWSESIIRDGPTGRQEYRVRVWRSDEDVAVAMGLATARRAQRMLTAARRKIKAALTEMVAARGGET